MMKLKHVYIFCLIAFIGFQCHAQTYKFLTTGFSVMEKTERGEWGKWSDLKDTSIIITLNTNKNRIIVYSQELQLYDIVSYENEQESDTDIVYTFNCTDNDGVPFSISIITRKNQGNRKQLYINQKDFIVVYNIVNYIEKHER